MSSDLPALTTPLPGRRAALVIAHPGHELRVFRWLELAQPEVFILTDGSGHSGESRIASSTRVLGLAAARAGSIFGALTDQALYKDMLGLRAPTFLQLLDALTGALAARDIDYVVGDACEGYNPSHDVCRLLIGAAVERLGCRGGRRIGNFDFTVTGPPDSCPAVRRAHSVHVQLSETVLERKLETARSYVELGAELRQAIAEFGTEAFRIECLRPCATRDGYEGPPQMPPYYEAYGERQVRAGIYRSVIRYREHLRPLAEALWNHVERSP